MNPKFKTGDKIRCIDDSYCNNNLTLDKVYTVIRNDGCDVVIIQDDGKETTRYEYRFTLEEKAKEEIEVMDKYTQYIEVADKFYALMGIVKGSLIKVTKKVESRSNGWRNSWNPKMDDLVGNEYRVQFINANGEVNIVDTNGSRWNLPFNVVEFVDSAVTVPSNIKISRDYDAKFNEDASVSVGCQKISYEVLESIYKAATTVKNQLKTT